jgi:RNA polymerase primary sigma factor
MSKFETSEGLPKYFKNIKNLNPLSKDEEQSLAILIQAGDRAAVQTLVKHNLKLVVTIANKFIGQGVAIDDLIQEGNLGLITAAERFSTEHNTRFSTYAQLWIRKHCNEAIATVGKIVRIPMNQEYDIYKKKKRGEEVPNFRPIQLDAKVSDEGEATVADRYAFVGAEADAYHDKQHADFQLARAISKLKERDREIIKLSFGINCDYALSSSEIAELFGLTQVRVCQIVKSSLAVMSK